MGLGSAAASALLGPFAVPAQQVERVRRVVALFPRAADDTEAIGRLSAFRQALLQLGWTDGRNMEIDVGWVAPDNPAEARRSAVELAALAPDVILATGSGTIGPLLEATRVVPIVFVTVADPVGAGNVDSLSRPDGNATGFVLFE